MRKPELLAPAGDLTKLKFAIEYGADAVYIGGEEFGLRSASKNFSPKEMAEGIKYAHERGKKVYVTVNIIPHNDEIDKLEEFLSMLSKLGADALIVADLGVFSVAKRLFPNLEIHVSTQANNVNYASANTWYELGAKRVVVARELSLSEIEKIRQKIPPDMDIEAFVHGAMCISYSGRCLLSNYLTGRDSNHGECAQPCRWKYALVEMQRPGQYIPIDENESGSFIFNSKDLCMIQHIPDLINAGISSFKIEGRVKSEYYVATVVKAYRREIDRYMADPENYRFDEDSFNEVLKVSHRPYTDGFYYHKPGPDAQVYESSSYIRDYDLVAQILSYDEKTGIAVCSQRNKFYAGDTVEILTPDGENFSQKIEWLKNEEGETIESTPHPEMIFTTKIIKPVNEFSMIRKGELVSGK